MILDTTVFFGSVIMDEGNIIQSSENSMMDSSKEAALLSLMDRTGYSMVQENGQRKFGGPPPGNMETAFKKSSKLGTMNNLCMSQNGEILLTSSQIAI